MPDLVTEYDQEWEWCQSDVYDHSGNVMEEEEYFKNLTNLMSKY